MKVFAKEQFIEDCRRAVAEGQRAVREVVTEAVSDPAGILAALGEPRQAGIDLLHRSKDLTVINFIWAPCMCLIPHNHQMYAAIGIYAGREDNVFWRRTGHGDGNGIEAAGAKTLGVGDVGTLGRDVIHSVINPIEKMSCALHVYGGDFFEPDAPRSEWDHETLSERPWNIETTRRIFREAESRFNAYRAA